VSNRSRRGGAARGSAVGAGSSPATEPGQDARHLDPANLADATEAAEGHEHALLAVVERGRPSPGQGGEDVPRRVWALTDGVKSRFSTRKTGMA